MERRQLLCTATTDSRAAWEVHAVALRVSGVGSSGAHWKAHVRIMVVRATRQ